VSFSTAYYIARRYLSVKRKKNVIHLITKISVIGIMVTTTALVILLSAFNGIEQMVEKLYSEFDTDLTVQFNKGKTFHERQIDFEKLRKIEGIASFSKVIEEVVVLKHEKKWVNAKMIGVEGSFLDISKMDQHLVDGYVALEENNIPVAMIGASLLDNLGGYIPEMGGNEMITFYAPKKNAKIRLGSNPFYTKNMLVAGRINYNREVNAEFIVVPLSFASELLKYNNTLTTVFIDVVHNDEVELVKARLQSFLGPDFTVRSNYEKNELIYKTSKSEKLIVFVILIFVFILAAFNLIASITMLFVEKMGNIKTMISFGVNRPTIFRIFFYEGLLISGKGILWGLIIGYGVCFLQVFGSFLEMPNSGGEAFPIVVSWKDAGLIFFIVSLLSVCFSYLPVKYLIKRNFKRELCD
jgi:lipoprotein-releasing system permease protein